jgi:hypothetical protein
VVEHPEAVLRFVHRLTTVFLAIALLAGNVGVCPGWAATPEARMACCDENGTCPMRRGQSDKSASGKALTQAQADSCCASSERDESTGPDLAANVVAISSAVLGDGVVIPTSIPALVLSDNWRTVVPIPIAPVPRHVLLSVFLL